MKVVVSKILNKTDLAQSGSHGGLVVTRTAQQALKEFFDGAGLEMTFKDKIDNEEFTIHYQDYTSNGTTPNDRVTPIGRYATKHDLQPGDVLLFERVETGSEKNYFLEYAKRISSIFFAGKSRTSVDVLNFDQFIKVLLRYVGDGLIKKNSPTEFEMNVSYLGVVGKLVISQNDEDFELIFNDVSISENKKYFELDTSVYPFHLKKTETWSVSAEASDDMLEANEEADEELILSVWDEDNNDKELYNPIPEQKAPKVEHKGKLVPARNKRRAKNALIRADYKCEFDPEHLTFKRKKINVPYTEPHHLIPLQYDDLFEYSLDVEANIVSLCSNCHNQIHYGAEIEHIIRRLWDKKKDDIEKAGIGVMKNGVKLTVEMLLSFYGM